MIVGTGIDLIEQARIRRSLARYGERFLQRLFTAQEIVFCTAHRDAAQHLAGRFAVKEACMKALGAGIRQGIRFIDIEILNQPSGAPSLHLCGSAAARAAELAVTRSHISLTHTGGMAAAVVVLETD